MLFKHPSNDYTEEVAIGFYRSWVLLFGPVYWAVKGVWKHVVLYVFLFFPTAGLVHLAYPFFAKSILRKHYLQNGWIEVARKATAEEIDQQRQRTMDAIKPT